MDSRKIYSYHKLDLVDTWDSVEWARENFERFDGETSPLWNEYVQREFVRLNKERNEWQIKWCNMWQDIAAEIVLQHIIDNADTPYLDEADFTMIPEDSF